MSRPRIRDVFRIGRFRPDPGAEIEEEIAFHFDEAVRRLVEQGRTPEEARREARRRFGDVSAYRTELTALEGRGVTGPLASLGAGLASIASAVLFALRGIRRSPGVGLIVVSTLALGLGANVAMFRVVDRLLLRNPEHVVEPERVRLLFGRLPSRQRALRMSGSYPDFVALGEVRSFESVAAYRTAPLVVGDGDGAEQMTVGAVTGDFFRLLGVDAVAGRVFGPEDGRPDSAPAAVLSAEAWERAYGADPDVIGSTVRMGNERYTVVGVAPPGFTGVDLSPVDAWVTLEHYASAEMMPAWRDSRGFTWLRYVARLAPGVSNEAAAAEATAVLRGAITDEAAREDFSIGTASLVAADRPDAGSEIRVARWLGAVSLVVLLIACANVANLLLTRNIRRRRELAVRAALGIGRRRLLGQLVAEAGILTIAGGLVAIALAWWAGDTFYGVLFPEVDISDAILDGRLLTFTAVAVVATTLLSGLIPAVQSSRSDLAATLKSGGERAGACRTRTQVGLLIAQVALSVVLLTGSTGFVRSVASLRQIDLGFEADGLALVELDVDGAPPGPAFFGPEQHTWPPNELARVYEEVDARLSELPGVVSALINPTPFHMELVMPFEVPGLDSIPDLGSGGPYPLAISPDYFGAMDLQLVEGRAFSPSDDRFGAERVVILSETMARTLWPGENPLGRCVVPGGDGEPCAAVIGVVEDAHRQAVVEDEPGMVYYVPIRQQILDGAPTHIFVRTTGVDLAAVRSAAQSASPLVRFARVTPFEEVTGAELRPWTLGAAVFTAFGALALLVASLGLYSLFAFDVAGRSRELGIRSALGASRGGLFGLVFRDIVLLGGTGIGLGFGAVALVRRWIDPLLYDTSALEVRTLAPVAILLLAVALMAGAVPGRRAASADPVAVLRAE